ncbi:peptidoglycan D,D-transpeptidase FtsI family protein [Ectobacillus ponti]|uniref:serine-type D-Ala-D-Ala carboxypeptidase n=1 Tax=Ectobacillus ponti TaxID=2961894 RepID=A0AA41X1A9_9BACI|nr:penicillin-binding protein 2 [Ectobacillus ponti]MCP8967139.1 penicillin-binding protein 2 [Ectobacillus ponti]
MKKSEKKRKSHVPFRLNLLFFLVFVMFSALILRLGALQIVYGDDYSAEVKRGENVAVSVPSPRGRIFDRQNRLIVGNVPLRTITYTRMQGATDEDRLHIAKKLAVLMHMPADSLTDRDKKDFWMQINAQRARQKITTMERRLLAAKKLTDQNIYSQQLGRVTPAELAELQSLDLEVLAIKKQMDSSYFMTPQVIKNKRVTEKEYAMISENLGTLPGVDTTVDWERDYKYKHVFRSVLGSVSSSNEGLPRERLDYYLVRGYDRNDRVGKSYLEQVYEDSLHGFKAKMRNVMNQDGTVLETVRLSRGMQGKDLVLTLDMELQKKVEGIIEEELRRAKLKRGTEFLDRALVVMMNPKNGEILAMAGKQLVEDKQGRLRVQDYAIGAMTSSYAMGSTVKGATVLAGFQTGAITPETILLDEPIVLRATPVKKSWTTMGNINYLTALERSSNVFMFKTAMNMAGVSYVKGGTLDVKQKAFDTMRYYFSQFGLGVRTGIDLPNESAGFKGSSSKPGFLLDLAIGQYDTYTPLQLVQYAATIANDGYRLKPQVIKEVRRPGEQLHERGGIVYSAEPVVLNRIDMDSRYVRAVQRGFWAVMHGSQGTAASYFDGAPYRPAGKTGTAQTFYDGPDPYIRKSGPFGGPPSCFNLTLVGYAPYENPEIAFSVVVPWLQDDKNPISKKIGRRILDAYFASQRR